MLAVGDKAPEFGIKNHKGEIVQLEDYAGKRLLIWFYPEAGRPG